ncbi:hypothetical protein Bca52824_035568 [Brassica carinata]|uniref:Uncharacterized protein n=1 Tax=Brassica carinata TaxID=52824 RepID=A0A8X7S3X4_BRACI|nr:hypothetical protein Bca52824_035568 [Brassica carinata]
MQARLDTQQERLDSLEFAGYYGGGKPDHAGALADDEQLEDATAGSKRELLQTEASTTSPAMLAFRYLKLRMCLNCIRAYTSCSVNLNSPVPYFQRHVWSCNLSTIIHLGSSMSTLIDF